MATSKSLKGCITTHGIASHERLPSHIREYAAQGRKDLMVSALEAHIKQLEGTKTVVKQTHRANVAGYTEAGVSKVLAGKVTNRPKDPTNELNFFHPKKIEKLIKNLVQRAGSFKDALKLGKNRLSAEETRVLKHFEEEWAPRLNRRIEQIFKVKEGSSFPHRGEDMMQYLPDREESEFARANLKAIPVTYQDKDGNPLNITTKLDPVTRTAIAATAFEWLMTSARSANGQTDQSLHRWLGLDKGEEPSGAAALALRDTGINAEGLAKTMGRQIVSRLGISPTGEADYLAKERLETSLGLMAIAALEAEGIFERQEIFTGQLSDAEKANREGKDPSEFRYQDGEFGFAGLRDGRDLPPDDVIYDETIHGKEGRIGHPTMKLMYISDETLASLEESQKLMRQAPYAFDSIFDNEPTARNFTWEKPKIPKVLHFGDTGEKVSKAQADNVRKYSEIPYNRSEATMGIFKQFLPDELDPDQMVGTPLGRMLGIVDGSTLLTEREKSVKGINRGIVKDVKAVLDWEADATTREEKGQSTDFYIPSTVWSTSRMGQVGDITLQGSKIHRNLFAPKGWSVTFKSSPKRQGKMDKAFLEAIAFAFDIESGKVGGALNQRKMLEDILTNPENKRHYAINWALEALGQYLDTQEMTPEMMELIADGVEATETKLHGLKGLVELARYQNHRTLTPNKPFTTDIYGEIDGVSNGPIIGTMMLTSDLADKQATLATVGMGGVSVSRHDVNLDEKIAEPHLNDAYQRMGQEWALQLELLRQKWLEKREQGKLDAAAALESFVGSFHKDGVVSKAVRNLSKPRTMQTTYGAGIARQTQLFTGSDVVDNGIYKQVEQLMADVQEGQKLPEDLRERMEILLSNVSILTGDPNDIRLYLDRDGHLDFDKLKDYRLSKQEIARINDQVKQTYGKAMKEAIDTVYGALIQARTPLLKLVQLQTTVYNTALKQKVQALMELKGIDPKKREFGKSITKDELKEITDSLKALVPKIKTPLHSESDPSYFPMAMVGDNKTYEKQAMVEQSYESGTVSGQSAYVQGIPFLGEVGPAPLVRGVQMLDSIIANYLMGLDPHILNNHDGFSHSIEHGDDVRIGANTRFHELMDGYSLGGEIGDMHKKAAQALRDTMEELGPDVVIDAILEDRLVDADLVEYIFGVPAGELYGRAKEPGMSLKKAIAEYVKDKARINPQQTMEELVGTLSQDGTRMAEQVTRNKQAIADAVTHSAQYPFRGKGVDIDTKSDEDTVLGVERDKVLSVDAKNTATNIETMQGLVGEAYQSSQGDVSTNPNDYPDSSKVDRMNVSQVFDSVVQQDQKAGYGKKDSPEHQSHLKGLVDGIVSKMMGQVSLFIGQHKLDEETKGLYTVDPQSGDKIWLQTQKLSTHPQPGALGHGIRMSAGEVLVHELVHHITHGGLKKDRFLAKQAYDLYELARTSLEAQYGANAFRAFLNDPNLDLSDPANAYEIQAAQDRWNHIFESPQRKDGSHSGVDEFLALGLTNENFRRELGHLAVPDKSLQARKALRGIFEKNLQTTLVNLFDRIMDILHQTFYKQEHSTRMDQELENMVRALAQVEGRTKSKIYRTLVSAENTLTDLSVRVVDAKIKDKAQDLADRTKVGQLISKLKQLPELDNMLSYRMRLVMGWYNDQQEGLIPSLVTEMQGTTERLRPLHDLLNRRNRVIDAAKVEAAATVREAVNSWFEEEPTPEQKTAVTKALLKTDISSLVDRSSLRAVQGYLESSSQRAQKIQSLIRELATDKELAPYRHFFENAAEDLGFYMVHSEARDAHAVPLMNAHNIALMRGTNFDGALTGDAFTRATDKIDQLASLYALNYVRRDDLARAAQMMADNSSAIENVLNHHTLLKERALKDNFNGQPALLQKGYTKQILNGRIQYEQGTLADKERFENAGFIMQTTPIQRDPSDPVKEDIYMFKSALGTVNDYQAGIMSLTRNAAKGTTAYDLQQQTGNFTGATKSAQANNQRMMQVTARKLADMFKPMNRPTPKPGRVNYMVPKLDVNGQITELRYMMSESTKDVVLEQFSEFDAVLAAMNSQIIDKQVTPEINADLVDALRDLYDAEFSKYPEAFVEISPYSTEQRHKDIYHMIPPKAQQKIFSTWGSPRMMVPRDIVDLAFGQRKVSITHLFAKDRRSMKLTERMATEALTFALGARNPFAKDQVETASGRAVTRAKAVEDAMSQLTKLAKSNIIVRNLGVTHGNYLSNVAYLKSKGIPLEKIMTLSREAAKSSLEYQGLHNELNLLQAQKEIILRKHSISQAEKDKQIRTMDLRIKRLENALANNPSTKMIAAGLMPQIVDDVDTGSIQSPHRFGIDAALEAGLQKLPGKAETAARTLFMTEDTEGFKMLNNAVKLTDYTGRYVLYHHYREQGMDHASAVSAVTDEFINFDLPTHRQVEYLNNIGILWFSKYGLRVLKHIKNVVKDRPFTSLATYILGSMLIGGNNILNSIPGVTKDVLQSFGDPLSAMVESPDDILYVDLLDKISGAAL